MQRRTNTISGCVNFPVDDASFTSTGEGGMFVKLVVCDDREFDNQFGVCCGVGVYDVLQECLIGDDQRPNPSFCEFSNNDYITELALKDEWLAYHFPRLNESSRLDATSERSRDYLFVAVLGSTGWSGSDSKQNYWTCTFNDLNDDGKKLYTQVQALYPDCKLHLLTFLDT